MKDKKVNGAAANGATAMRQRLTGVPGELVDANAEGMPAGVVWGRLRVSPYLRLLNELTARPTAVLKFTDRRARAAIAVQAKRLDMEIEFGEEPDGNTLFVRLKEMHGEVAARRREIIRGALKSGPVEAIKLAVMMRDKGDAAADGGIVRAIAGQMVRVGELVVQESGAYALNPRFRAGA